MLVSACENQALSKKCVYEWFASFRKAGKVFLTTPVAEDWQHPSVTKTLREKVRKLIIKDRQLIVLMVAEELHINRESMRQIVTQNSGMRETCYRY
ncbi:hypothetical protein TNCV_3469201 [Trichonephila clavipes]|nr:hypothetical protein TNCV_3469201 [Trichonephila clavipes]